MIILYVGNFKASSTTETHVMKTLQSMGHEVIPQQENDLRHDLVERVKQFKSDFVMWTRTWTGFVTIQDIVDIREMGIVTVSYHLDLYMGISRESTIPNDPFWRTDYVFTPDGDPMSQRKFESLGINHHYLPAAVFEEEAYRGTYNPQYACDVAFFGSVWNYHQDWPYRQELVESLRSSYGDGFRIFGHPYGSVRGKELNDALASARVIVGDSLVPGYTHANYWSDRLYEITGRGGFLIFPLIVGLDTQFDLTNELMTYRFGDFQTLKGYINYFLLHDDVREEFRARGMERTLRDHTYKNRMDILLEVIERG